MKSVRWLVGLLVAWHIGLALLYNVCGAVHSMAMVRPQLAGPSTSAARWALDYPERSWPIALYSHFTGLATGYGFFAPQVASPFELQLVCCYGAAQPCDTLAHPSWATGTYAVRYRAFTSSLRALLPEAAKQEATDSLTVRYTRILAAHVAQRTGRLRQATSVRWQVQAIGLPTLRGQGIPYRYLLAQDSIFLNATNHALAIP